MRSYLLFTKSGRHHFHAEQHEDAIEWVNDNFEVDGLMTLSEVSVVARWPFEEDERPPK